MSIYNLNVNNVSRAKRGNAVKAYAYLSGEEVKNEKTGEMVKYKREDTILAKGNVVPADAPAKYKESAANWCNDLEMLETSEKARTAKRVKIAFPREMTLEEMEEAAQAWIKENCTDHGYLATYAIHEGKDPFPKKEEQEDGEKKEWEELGDKKTLHNPHVHILVSNRAMVKGQWEKAKSKTVYKLDERGEKIPLLDEEGKQKVIVQKDGRVRPQWQREIKKEYRSHMDKLSTLYDMRESWSRICNKYLSPENQIDHRSYKDQGKLQIPTKHEGYKARAMEARGEIADVCEYNRQVKIKNKEIQRELAELDAAEAKRQQAIASIISDVSSRITKNLKGKEAAEVEGALWDIKNMMYDAHSKELEAEAAKQLGLDQEQQAIQQAIVNNKNAIVKAEQEHQRERKPLMMEEAEAGKQLEQAQRNLKKLEKIEEERMNGGFLKMLLSKKDKAGLAKAGKALQQAEKRQLQAKTALSTLDQQHQARFLPLQTKAGQLEARANGINAAIMGKVDEIGSKQVYGYAQIEKAINKFDNRHALPGPVGKAVGIAKGVAGEVKGVVGQGVGAILGKPNGKGMQGVIQDTIEQVVQSAVKLDPVGAGMAVARMPLATLQHVESEDVQRDKMREAMEQTQAEEGLLLGGKGKSKPKGKDKDKEASQDQDKGGPAPARSRGR